MSHHPLADGRSPQSRELGLPDLQQTTDPEGVYRSLMALLPIGVYTCAAPSGVITFYNAQAASLWGRAPRPGDSDERFCGSFRLWLPDGTPLPHDETPMALAIREGRAFRNEDVVIERPDGSRISVLVNIDPLFDADGRVIGAVNAFHDTTEIKATQEQLRRSERELAEFFDNASLPLHWVGPDGVVLRVNQAELDMLGYRREEYLGRSIAEFHADPTVISDILRRLSAGETLRDYEARLRCKDGSIKDVLIDSSVLWDGGKFVHTRCFTRDITERKRAEEVRRRLASIVESTDDAVIGEDLDGTITSWNGGAERMYGYTADEIVGRHISILFPPNHSREFAAIMERIRSGERVEHYETVRFTKDGRCLDVSLTISPLKDADGRIVGVSKIARDVTERKRTDRLKDEFLATLAHELRNPLAPIRTGVQLLRRAGNNPAVLEKACPMMERQLQQMVRLVDDLLDISRVSRNKLELRKEWVALTAIVQSALETSRPLIEDAGHELIVSMPDVPVVLDADTVRLAQAFSNLLNNAAKYTNPGGRIQVTAELVDGGKGSAGEVIVRVRDNGIGIPADKLPHIFEMFVQADTSLERVHGGLGIGLTLAQRLIQMHGGSLSASSDGAGAGSEFTVRLPVAIMPTHADERVADGGTTTMPRVRRRILVVDDNEDSAEMLSTMLGYLGHELTVAHDGLEAVEQVRLLQPDIAFVDLGMPNVNGYEAARRIREQPGGDRVMLVAVTGWGQDEDKRRSREAGFDAHLVKPVDLAAIEALVNSRSVGGVSTRQTAEA